MQDNEPMWTTDGLTASAGDHFGDVQAGVAEVLTFTRPDRPNERVSVTFGTVLNQARRFSGEITVEHETNESGDWEHVPGTGLEYENGAFYQDYETLAPALRDVADAIKDWSKPHTSADLGIE